MGGGDSAHAQSRGRSARRCQAAGCALLLLLGVGAMRLLRPGWDPRLLALLALALLPRGALADSCGGPPKLTSAELQDQFKNQTNFPVGTVVKYTCRPGYMKVPGESPAVSCGSNLEWSPVKEFCQRKSCAHPGDLEHGRVHVTDLLFGSEVTFSCVDGYRLFGAPSSRCVIDGRSVTWSHEIPFCEAIPCLPPPEIINGKHSGEPNADYTYGSSVTYSCNTVPKGSHPFSLIGEASIYCTSDTNKNGVWNAEAPICKVVKCSNAEVENGRKLSGFGPSYTYQNAIQFECNSGYYLVGSDVIKCQANNLWDPAIPTCEKATPSVCGAPEFPNGKMFPSKPQYVGGDAVTLTCEANYNFPNGAKSMTVVCRGDNVWNPPVQNCQGTPDVSENLIIGNGRIKSGEKSNYSIGDIVTIECYTGYTLHGEPTLQYVGRNKWEPKIPICKLSVYIIVIICVIVIAAVVLVVIWMYKKFFSQKGKHVSTSPTASYTSCKA
ncbi:membrane cofactor protein-like isoform X2 [Emydura macquarii macquarii]|uniref:membrane cofactor protein-like isoform X2 n=1 Tax=Emydura macquarii macquarii TaxID=1129001 RepID=UPI00352A3911